MRARAYSAILFVLLATAFAGARADELLMARVNRPFPEAMARLQDSIVAHGYTISHIQRVDLGLKANGYKTAEYRVVFFGKPKEMRELPAEYAPITAYLPLQIVIYAEGDDTIILAADPHELASFFPQPALQPHFATWERDFRAIFNEMRKGGE